MRVNMTMDPCSGNEGGRAGDLEVQMDDIPRVQMRYPAEKLRHKVDRFGLFERVLLGQILEQFPTGYPR